MEYTCVNSFITISLHSYTGSPSPTVCWYFNGALLKDSDEIQQKFDGEHAQLIFKDVFPDDTGRYEAIATNRIGEVKSACILTVRGIWANHSFFVLILDP